MSASLSSVSTPSPLPEAKPVSRSAWVGWLFWAFLSVGFVGALYCFPPLQDAAKGVPTPQWAQFLGRFHPIAVHLPVGVLFLVGFLELLALTNRNLATALQPALGITLGVGAFGGIWAVVCGVLLSREGGYSGTTFQAHQMLGIVTVVGALLALALKLSAGNPPRGQFFYRLVLLGTLGVMSVGAHFGGNMVHGKDYLLEHVSPEIRAWVLKNEGRVLQWFEKPKPETEPMASVAGAASSPAAEEPAASPTPPPPSPAGPPSVPAPAPVALEQAALEPSAGGGARFTPRWWRR